MQIGGVNQFQSQPDRQVDTSNALKKPDEKKQSVQKDSFELSDEEKKMVEKLKARDREVRVHENQHKAVAGQYARGVSYSYQTGPDNQRYAIGGSVDVDMAPVPDDPEKTIEKMKVIKRAALAPAEPSGKDKQIASEADREISKQEVKATKKKEVEAKEAYREVSNSRESTISIYT